MNLRRFFISILLVSLVIGLVINFNEVNDENVKQVDVLQKDSGLKFNRGEVNGSAITKNYPNDVKEVSLSLSTEFDNAVNFRYLFERLKTSKETNGSFYLLKIIEKCMKIRGQNDVLKRVNTYSDHKIAHKRDQIFTKHQILCSQFLKEEISHESYSVFLRKASEDNLVKTISNLRRLDSKNNFHCNNLKDLFSSNSPEAIGASTIYSDARGDYFDGKFYGKNDPVLRNGMKLALCELGKNCSSSNFEVENLCLEKGICESSLKDALKQDFGLLSKDSELMYKETVLISEKISNSIKSSKISNFTPFSCN